MDIVASSDLFTVYGFQRGEVNSSKKTDAGFKNMSHVRLPE